LLISKVNDVANDNTYQLDFKVRSVCHTNSEYP